MKIAAGLVIGFVTLLAGIVLYGVFSDFANFSGGAGSIKAYDYPVKKYELQKTVNIVLKNEGNLKRDSIIDYYNDDENYITMNINQNGIAYRYTFRYFGDSANWNNSLNSEIFIAYAWDDKNNGGAEGHGDFKGQKSLKKKLTDAFEKEFIKKIDNQLGKSHTEPD